MEEQKISFEETVRTVLSDLNDKILEFDERLAKVEKILAKSQEKSVFDLQCEIEHIKDVLLEETPGGKEKPTAFSKIRMHRLKKLQRRL